MTTNRRVLFAHPLTGWPQHLHVSTQRGWSRHWGGYQHPDGDAYVERGARMTGGGTAWLVWLRVWPGDLIATGEDPWEYDVPPHAVKRLGYNPSLRTSSDLIDMRGHSSENPATAAQPVYVHTNDAGSLAEAKATVAAVLRDWAADAPRHERTP